VRRLEFAEIARSDLKSIRRYSQGTWGQDRTIQRASFLVRPSIIERFAIVSGRGADAINRPVTMPE
jgi:hypothetical protein